MSDHTGQHVPTNVEVGMTDGDELVGWLRARLGEDEASMRTWLANLPADSGAADWVRQWLVEVDAKRRIIDVHYRIECQHDRNYGPGGDCAECGNEYPCETVDLLALPYAGRPGYRDEWRG